jgi:predicted enzyme related to lactoylglutathione lyase
LQTAYFILYVEDQELSTELYSTILSCPPRLDVPGMTEFELTGGSVLGLMPITGIKRLLGDALPDPQAASGVPRAELYLLVGDPEQYLERAVTAGAQLLSPLQDRNWGHSAGYCLDPDGHVIAFARPTGEV